MPQRASRAPDVAPASRPNSGSRAGCSAGVPPVPHGDRKPSGLTGGTPALRGWGETPLQPHRRDAAPEIFRAAVDAGLGLELIGCLHPTWGGRGVW